ncbi:MAG: tetratricopeptide repeat protein [Bacteroidales bacterium]|jgi:tetratricopeptide (TPR) repeat protein|nr:tetratricopeptide repeat protein [Bacteroidales bacterium]
MKKSIINSNWLPLLIIVGITLGIYAQAIKFDFIYFDENTILLQNKSFFTTQFSIKKTFTTDAFIYQESAFYRPLQNLSFALDAFVAGDIKPWAYHLSNLIIFVLIGISLYYFLLQLKFTPKYALCCTLLFLANPLNVWSVVWIPSRGDLFVTLFTLLAFICFINFLKTNRFTALFMTFISFSLALFSKETAALIPFLFLLFFICENNIDVHSNLFNKIFAKINYKHLLLATLMFCIGVLWFYLRYHAILHYEKIININDFLFNLLNFPVVLSQIVFPYEFSPFPKFSFTKIILGSLIMVILIIIIVKKTDTSRWEKLFFVAWFILFLFPTLFIRGIDVDYFEHRYLLPQIGILVLLAKTAKTIYQNIRHKLKFRITALSHSLITLMILIFGITSFVKARTLKNIFTVVEAVDKYKGNGVNPYTNRGSYYVDNEMYDNAIKDFSKALQFNPKNVVALNNLAKLNMLYEEYENAIALYNISISINNRFEGAFYNRSLAKTFLGDFEGALQDIDSAILINNKVALLYNNRGVLKMNMGFSIEAISDFDEAIKLSKSTYTEAFGNRAFVQYRLGFFAEAMQDCEKALQLEPDNIELLMFKDSIQNRLFNIY